MDSLPPDHKARWFAGAALSSSEQAMASVMSTALARLIGPGFVGQLVLLFVQIGVFVDKVQEVKAIAFRGVAQVNDGNPVSWTQKWSRSCASAQR